MNQENKFLIFVICVFGLSSVVIQSVIIPMIEVNLWRPDIVLVIVLLSGRRFGSAKGSTVGFILGIIQDSLSTLPVGITAFPKVLAGYAAGKSKLFRLEGTMYFLWFVLFIFIHELITYFFLQFKMDVTYSYLVFSRVFPNTVYTTLMLFVLNFFLGKYFKD